MTDPPPLAAVKAAPWADAPRLAYADWLSARGETARADFIRVQLELAALAAAGKRPSRDDLNLRRCECRPCTLTREETELWLAHGVDWMTAEVFAAAPGVTVVAYHRGFVTTVRVAQTALFVYGDPPHAGDVGRLGTVEAVDMPDFRPTVPDPRAEAYVGTDLGYAATTTFRDRLILAGDVVWPLRPFAPTTEAAGWVGWRSGGSGYRTIRLLLTDQDLRSGHIGQLDYCWTTVDHARAAVHRAAARYCRSLTGLPPWPP